MPSLFDLFYSCLETTFFKVKEEEEDKVLFEGFNYGQLVEVSTYTNVCHNEMVAKIVFNDTYLKHIFKFLDMYTLNHSAMEVCKFWFIHISNDKNMWTPYLNTDLEDGDEIWHIRDWIVVKPVVLNSFRVKGKITKQARFYKNTHYSLLQQHRTPRDLFIINELPNLQVLTHACVSKPCFFRTIFPTKHKPSRPTLSLNFNFILLGYGGCGKTSLLNVFKTGYAQKPEPTQNFTIDTIPVSSETNLTVLDRGELSSKEIIFEYIKDMDGLIYMIDSSSCSDDDMLLLVMKEFAEYMDYRYYKTSKQVVPVLILCNKCDLISCTNCVTLESVYQFMKDSNNAAILGMLNLCPIRIQYCSTKTRYGIDRGIDWFVKEMSWMWYNGYG